MSKKLLMICGLSATLFASATYADSKIKGTGGVSSIDGSSGGGLIPWATLGSYAMDNEIGATGFITRAEINDFELAVAGVSANYHDRIEVSLARQKFTIKANDASISQDKIGLKVKLAGDVIYGAMPQISAGLVYSKLRDPATAVAVGADSVKGNEIYLSGAKVWLNSIANRTAMLNINARYSEANQYGLLGFGGDDQDKKLQWELAAALFITRSVAIGFEYRQKPDNLSALTEQAAQDIFIAWFPNKNFSVTAAWLDLGEIAGSEKQTGTYLSIQGAF